MPARLPRRPKIRVAILVDHAFFSIDLLPGTEICVTERVRGQESLDAIEVPSER